MRPRFQRTQRNADHLEVPLAGDEATSGKLPTSHMRSRIMWSCAALLVVGIVGCSWLVFRANQIETSLTRSAGLATLLVGQIKGGDHSGVHSTFMSLREESASAREASTDPLWRAAATLPVIGSNFSALTAISVSADDITNRAVAPLIEDVSAFDWQSLSPTDGRIDLEPIAKISPKLATAAMTVELSQERLATIDRRTLFPQIADPLAEATERLDEYGRALRSASDAARLVPQMLGTSERRTHLLLIQNSAEVRATGGIPGAIAVIDASDGELELTGQSSASRMGEFDPPVIVDPDQVAIYSTRMGRFIQSVNLTPEFPTVAETAAMMWEQRNEGSDIDGVISLDPTALSYILHATGPVDLSITSDRIEPLITHGGLPTSLTAENVVPTLLSDVYAAIEDPSLQDAYFAAVASRVFDAITTSPNDASSLVNALIRSADEGRLHIWSRYAEEQAIIGSTDLAGSVTGSGSGGASFGAYFNDGTGAKMDYYVRRTTQLHRSCTPDGYLQYTLTATLTNTAPSDAATVLPAYVTGDGAFGVPPGTVQTNFIGYGPDQSQLQTARIDGQPNPLGSYRHGGRPVGVLTTRLAPGETVTLELDFTNVVQTSQPTLDVTPTIQPLSEVVLPLQGDTACT